MRPSSAGVDAGGVARRAPSGGTAGGGWPGRAGGDGLPPGVPAAARPAEGCPAEDRPAFLCATPTAFWAIIAPTTTSGATAV
ncbi:MAG: hypothetical protein QG655_3861, partial [Actinomycetota bacterium]|nr:hypothetical protein [Actinomycetota bacterium]